MSELAPQEERMELRQCARHGEYQARVTTHDLLDHSFQHVSNCLCCISEEAARVNELAMQKRRREVERLRAKSGVPARFAAADFASYDVANERMQVARRLLTQFAAKWDAQSATGQSLLLVGGPGTGKTHLACAIVNAIAEELTWARYGTAAELVGVIKRNYGRRGGDDSADVIECLQTVPLLVVDELDIGLSDHDHGRYANLRPMVLISNRSVEQLEQLLGQRVMDRLRECAVTVAFDWASHRGASRPRGLGQSKCEFQ